MYRVSMSLDIAVPKFYFPSPLFPVNPFYVSFLQVKKLKALLPSSILATCPVHLNLPDLIALSILGERQNYD